jgi:hypothetical protein
VTSVINLNCELRRHMQARAMARCDKRAKQSLDWRRVENAAPVRPSAYLGHPSMYGSGTVGYLLTRLQPFVIPNTSQRHHV